MDKSGSDFVILQTLKTYFGHDNFIPSQEAIIKDILKGQDVFALLATGGGKSLCYQLPALVLKGITLSYLATDSFNERSGRWPEGQGNPGRIYQ